MGGPEGHPGRSEAKNGLAVQTEDHPLEYLDFHGEIPQGHYGAGTMKIFDRGTFEVHKWRDKEVMVTFHGERVRGKYVLFRTGGKNWMIHRMDPPEDPTREPLPEWIEPMLASPGELPARRRLGVRDQVGRRARDRLRRGRPRAADQPPHAQHHADATRSSRALGRALGTHEAVLDGEIVAFESGTPSFQRLQRRMNLTSEAQVRRIASHGPRRLHASSTCSSSTGTRCWASPTRTGASCWPSSSSAGDAWQTPAHHVGDGEALLAASRAQGLEGIVAKRLDCPYLPGRRSPAWVKVKNKRTADVVVGGWIEGEGGRAGRLGALVLGFYEDGELRYAGRAGSGFTDAELKRVEGLLAPLARDDSPFTGHPAARSCTHFVEPQLVASVEYTELTETGTLRHPVYKGLRDDIDPADVTPAGLTRILRGRRPAFVRM